ncbi:hypothetical protein SUGI_0285210 [Cryptomeria japonica]|uniref:probable carboxylesterase 17 n=1 Tax=Cryptomeria japonica TaxID=3369 RepID=UPI002408E95F|nr:probable carboxylesterase 17 [Cryptomeria japonica]GLJ16623.1 hypothetical protein SUGI_0285210 [Cryptomeria japonica]
MEGKKQVVEEVPGELKLFSDGSVERTPLPIPLVHPIPPSNHTFIDGVATKDVPLNEATGVWARIYLPEKETEEKLPLVIHFHGGGFCVSHVDWRMYYYFYSRLARELQVVVVSVDYRLAPEHRLPAACLDCVAAVEWIRTLAEMKEEKEPWITENVDFRRCFLMGESAGANLAHQTALAYATEESFNPLSLCGCILIHPGFLRNERSKSETETVPKTPFITVEKIDGFLKLALPEGSTKDHPIINPTGPQAQPLHGLKLPKMLVAIADGDLMRDTQMEFCQAMINSGQSVEVIVSENVEHYFHVNEFAIAEDAQVAAQASNLVAAIDRFSKAC